MEISFIINFVVRQRGNNVRKESLVVDLEIRNNKVYCPCCGRGIADNLIRKNSMSGYRLNVGNINIRL